MGSAASTFPAVITGKRKNAQRTHESKEVIISKNREDIEIKVSPIKESKDAILIASTSDRKESKELIINSTNFSEDKNAGSNPSSYSAVTPCTRILGSRNAVCHEELAYNSPLRSWSSNSSPRSSVPNNRRFNVERGIQSEVDGSDDQRSPSSQNLSDASSNQNNVAEIFAQAAMSLNMDHDDLLFNMMFFDDGTGGTFNNIINTVQHETLALHSEHNTPYKLKPASETAINCLIREKFSREKHSQHDSRKEGEEDMNIECAVCRDDIEEDSEILIIPACKHHFHSECLLRWISLQAWCPVCRAVINPSDTETPHEDIEHNSIHHFTALDRVDEDDQERFQDSQQETGSKVHPLDPPSKRGVFSEMHSL